MYGLIVSMLYYLLRIKIVPIVTGTSVFRVERFKNLKNRSFGISLAILNQYVIRYGKATFTDIIPICVR
jgi:hypothetical protein